MNERPGNDTAAAPPDAVASGAGIEPLPGEPGIPDVATVGRPAHSRKGLLALALVVLILIAVTAVSIQRFFGSDKPAGDADPKRTADRPSAAAAEPRRLDFTNAAASQPQHIPALIPTAEEKAEPIGVRRTGQGATGEPGPAGASGAAKPISPEDAPVILLASRSTASPSRQAGVPASQAPPAPVSAEPDDTGGQTDPLQATKRNLQGYQQQLQGMLETLTRSTALATGGDSPTASGAGQPPTISGVAPSAGLAAPSAGLFGGQLQGSATPRVIASHLGKRSLTLPKGTAFTCALKTKIISAASGFVGCLVQGHVFSEDGRVLLLERGSHMDGEYRIASVRPGTVRIPVLWTRIRTPLGVTVDIESSGTGPLGESGVDGHVDNRWGERIGAAMLMSLIDDSVQLIIQNQTSQNGDDGSSTVVLPSTTANTSKLAEKVLDSTINIPPLIYQNQGGVVGIYVARDVDFSSVYELKAVAR